MRCRVTAGLVAVWIGWGAADAAVAAVSEAVGTATVVVREVLCRAGTDARPRQAEPDRPVYRGETIETGDDSGLVLKFTDGAELSMGPDSRVAVEEYGYDPETSSGHLSLKIGLGVARFATGGMPAGNYALKTPSATIGLHGTRLAVNVYPRGLTTVVLYEGAVTVANKDGQTVDLSAPDTASTIIPWESDKVTNIAPSQPGPVPFPVREHLERIDAVLHRGSVAPPPRPAPPAAETAGPAAENTASEHPEEGGIMWWALAGIVLFILAGITFVVVVTNRQERKMREMRQRHLRPQAAEADDED